MTAPMPMAATSQRFSLEPLDGLFRHQPAVFVIGHRDHDITRAAALHQGKEKAPTLAVKGLAPPDAFSAGEA